MCAMPAELKRGADRRPSQYQPAPRPDTVKIEPHGYAEFKELHAVMPYFQKMEEPEREHALREAFRNYISVFRSDFEFPPPTPEEELQPEREPGPNEVITPWNATAKHPYPGQPIPDRR